MPIDQLEVDVSCDGMSVPVRPAAPARVACDAVVVERAAKNTLREKGCRANSSEGRPRLRSLREPYPALEVGAARVGPQWVEPRVNFEEREPFGPLGIGPLQPLESLILLPELPVESRDGLRTRRVLTALERPDQEPQV